MIVFIIVYLAALACYLYTRNSGRIIHRAINKYLMATMYLVLAITMTLKKYGFTSWHTLFMAALIFAWLGDVFLVFDFGRGGDFFLAGNICFILYEQIVMLTNGRKWTDFLWTFPVAAVLLGSFIISCQKWPKIFKMGKMRWPMTLYLSTIITHGMTGLAMALLLPGTNWMVMGIGSVLFMISDMILTSYKFVFDNNVWLVRANSLTYFTGLLLIALSTTM